MKLLNHSTKYFALLLILLISVWAALFYVAMLDEVYDSLDDGLENQKMLIIQESKTDPSILDKKDFGIGNFIIQKTSLEESGKFADSYRDTLMFMQNEAEYEPARILESVFERNGSYYRLKLITSMVEEDDQIENLIKYLIGLYVLLVVSIIVLNNLVLKKVWSPFYSLIDKLKDFRIEKDDPISPEPTVIDEFALLNKSVQRLTEKSRDTYNAQKQFIENAAHELQTPLAIAINKLELLLEKGEISGGQSQEIASVLDNLARLTRLNRSLLLLSKIDNQQYLEATEVDFRALSEKISSDFDDFAAHRDIDIKIGGKESLVGDKASLRFFMNEDLATILMTNLIKNAIVHGAEGKTVEIEIGADRLSVTNFGAQIGLDSDQLFNRFEKSGSDTRSTGLGLAIAKAISDRYGLDLTYHFFDRHVFELRFPAENPR